MTDKEINRYLELVDRRLFILTHSGIDWQPEYGPELAIIDQELAELRKAVDAEHEKRERSDKGVSKQYLSAAEVGEIMNYSISHSYAIIKQLNAELKAKGYIIRSGQIPRKYFMERVGLEDEQSGVGA